MAYSMTGYGRGESLGQGICCIVEIRSVNHRFREIVIHAPREFLKFEDRLKRFVAEHVGRGRIDIFITLEEAGESLTTVKINRNITDAYIAIARQLSDDLELSWDIGVTGFLSLPGVLELTSMEVDSEEIWGLIEQSADQAMTELKEMRAKEGQFLVGT